jgi:hypothetical protein
MKILLSQIVNSKESLEKLLGEKLPIKTAYRIQKIYRQLQPELAHYEELRTKLITEKYGTEESEGSGNWKVRPENNNEFIRELTELLSVEIDIEFVKVKLPDTSQMSPTDSFMLEWMLDFEDDETKEEIK